RDFIFFIGNDTFEKLKSFQLKTNDLIISCSGTVGKISVIKEDDPKGIISQALLILRPDVDKLEINYLYYFLSSKQGFELLTQASHGSVQINIAERKVVEKIPFLLPSLPEQKAIAAVLSSLDDKIDLLHRQNKTLEAMAETLFRQWFIEEAQEDWKDGVISDLVEFNPPRKLAKGTIAPYFEMASLSTTTFNPDVWYDREFSSGTKFINGDTLLARITPCLENGKTAYLTILENNQVGWGSTEYIVMRSNENLHPFFTYTLARNSDFRDFAEGCLAGSSGRQRVEISHLMGYPIKKPSLQVIEQFNAVADSIVPKLHSNAVQIRTLESLRDTLLPKLMSGEVRVNV
ncbi:restriction endonuclease subunit S, partial [Methylomonas rivi]